MTTNDDAIETVEAAQGYLMRGLLPPPQLLAQLKPTQDVDHVAPILQCTKWAIYEQVRAGTFPLEALRVGRLLRFRTSDLLDLVLGASRAAS